MPVTCTRPQGPATLAGGLGHDEQDLPLVRQGLHGQLVQGDVLCGGHAPQLDHIPGFY